MEERPDTLPSASIKTKVSCGSIYIHICSYQDAPFEVFISMGIGGNCLATRANTLGKLISVALREVPVEKRVNMLTTLSAHMLGARCSKPLQNLDGSIANLSCEDAIGQAILAFLSDQGIKVEVPRAKRGEPPQEPKKQAIVKETPADMVHGPCPICKIGMMTTRDKTPCPTCDNPKCHYKECD